MIPMSVNAALYKENAAQIRDLWSHSAAERVSDVDRKIQVCKPAVVLVIFVRQPLQCQLFQIAAVRSVPRHAGLTHHF